MKKIISFVCVFVCTIIGASFITGNEVFLYFAQYNKSENLIILMATLLLFSSLIICLKFYNAKKENIVEAFEENKKFKIFAYVVKSIILVSYFAFGALMLAGLRTLFGIPFCLILVIFSFVFLQYDLNGIVKMNVLIFPFVIIYLLILAHLVLTNASSNNFLFNSTNFLSYFNVLPYIALNVLLLCGSILHLSKTMQKRQLIISIIISTVVFSSLILIQTKILKLAPLTNLEMPLIEISLNNAIFYHFTMFVTFLAMFSSFLSSSFVLYNKVKKSSNKYFNLLLILLLMFLCSLFSFSAIISFSYTVLGVVSCIVVVFLIFKKL